MTWLIGLHVKDVEKIDYSWFFRLSDGSVVATESPWRLITAHGLAVTSEDEGHKFGLPSPVNAAQRVKDSIEQTPIVGFELREKTSDLILRFAGDTTIEFLSMSCGYEGWRTSHGGKELICIGGGGVAEDNHTKK